MKIRVKLPGWLIYGLKLPFKRWAYEIIDQLVLFFVQPGSSGAVLVYRLDLAGDYLMCRPFFNSLKEYSEWNKMPFTFAGNQMLRGLAEELDGNVFSDFIWLDRNRFINSLYYRFHTLADIRRRGFSVLIYPSHTRQYWLESVVRVSGAGHRITASPVGRYMADWELSLSFSWYTKVLETGTEPQFEFYRNRNFFSRLAPEAGNISSMAEPRYSGIEKKKLILLAPGASTEERKWPAVNFSLLITQLAAAFPDHTFGLIGSLAENEECRNIIADSNVAARNYAGEFNLFQSMNLIAEACLLISNESGPVHMAATTGTACVCISNGNHFSRWNPYPSELAPDIQTCYPSFFGDPEKNREKLIGKYHEYSRIQASEVPFPDVFRAAASSLENSIQG